MNEVIPYEPLVAFLENARLFDIYRVSVALKNELDNPARIKAVRKKFKAGDAVDYFNEEANSFISARVLAKNPPYVSVQHGADGQHGKLPYYLLKIDSRDFDFSSSKKGLSKNALTVGDLVGFNQDGSEVGGRVERLNQKTVSLITRTHHKWRVAYSLLYTVIDGERHHPAAIEHQPS